MCCICIPAKSSMLISHEYDAFILQCFIINLEIYILTFYFHTPLISFIWCSKCWHLKAVVPFLLLALVPLEQTEYYIWTVYISHASTVFFSKLRKLIMPKMSAWNSENLWMIICGLHSFLIWILCYYISPTSVKISSYPNSLNTSFYPDLKVGRQRGSVSDRQAIKAGNATDGTRAQEGMLVA